MFASEIGRGETTGEVPGQSGMARFGVTLSQSRRERFAVRNRWGELAAGRVLLESRDAEGSAQEVKGQQAMRHADSS